MLEEIQVFLTLPYQHDRIRASIANKGYILPLECVLDCYAHSYTQEHTHSTQHRAHTRGEHLSERIMRIERVNSRKTKTIHTIYWYNMCAYVSARV